MTFGKTEAIHHLAKSGFRLTLPQMTRVFFARAMEWRCAESVGNDRF
jgi:hypothetical protein